MCPKKTQISLRIHKSDQSLHWLHEETLHPWLQNAFIEDSDQTERMHRLILTLLCFLVLHLKCVMHFKVCTKLVTSYVAVLGGSVGCVSNLWSGCCRFCPHGIGNILLWRLIMKYFLWSFSHFCWFKKGSCHFLAKNLHNTGYLLRGLSVPSKRVVR